MIPPAAASDVCPQPQQAWPSSSAPGATPPVTHTALSAHAPEASRITLHPGPGTTSDTARACDRLQALGNRPASRVGTPLLWEAAAAWHRAQEFRAQARAAAGAAVLLREAAAALTGTRPQAAGPKPRAAGTTRKAGRGLLPVTPVTGVPARPRPGQGPPDRPGPARTR